MDRVLPASTRTIVFPVRVRDPLRLTVFEPAATVRAPRPPKPFPPRVIGLLIERSAPPRLVSNPSVAPVAMVTWLEPRPRLLLFPATNTPVGTEIIPPFRSMELAIVREPFPSLVKAVALAAVLATGLEIFTLVPFTVIFEVVEVRVTLPPSVIDPALETSVLPRSILLIIGVGVSAVPPETLMVATVPAEVANLGGLAEFPSELTPSN